VSFDVLFRAGALASVLFSLMCFAVLITGVWVFHNPADFWDQFNPYLKPYHRLTLALGKLIGTLWAFGAALGFFVFIANAIRASLQHRWIR
jgi:hypothetical protein